MKRIQILVVGKSRKNVVDYLTFLVSIEDEYSSLWSDSPSDLIPASIQQPKRHVARGRPKRNPLVSGVK